MRYKKISKPVLRWLGQKLVHLLIHTLGFEQRGKLPEPGAIIFGIHEEFIPHIGLIGKLKKQGIEHTALTSLHRDGDSIDWLLQVRGIEVVRGSSSRGGTQALQELLRTTRNNPTRNLAIIADGPRGPRREIKPGVILLAKRSGRPVHLVRFSYRHKQLKTWDKHKLPSPFARVVFKYSEPVTIARKADISQVTQQLEELLTQTDQRAYFC